MIGIAFKYNWREEAVFSLQVVNLEAEFLSAYAERRIAARHYMSLDVTAGNAWQGM